jgi:hypothetical protein
MNETHFPTLALPRIEGVAVKVNGNLNRAISEAGGRYLARFGRKATHVALPCGIEATVNLYRGNLRLGYPTCPDLVIVGRPVDGNGHV